jgi:hypothetical protein
MKKFNVELELTEKELELLTKVDWKGKDPKEPYGMTTEVNSLCEKGAIVEYVDRDYADSAIFLTEVGKQIIKLIN